MKNRIIVSTLLALLAIITLLAAAPALGVIFTSVVASALHCRVDEGGVHPCVYNGHDIGSLLYDLGVLGWMMLVTLPVLFIALLAWIGVAIIFISKRRQSTKQ